MTHLIPRHEDDHEAAGPGIMGKMEDELAKLFDNHLSSVEDAPGYETAGFILSCLVHFACSFANGIGNDEELVISMIQQWFASHDVSKVPRKLN